MTIQMPPKRETKLFIDTSLAIVNIVLLLIFFFLVVGQQSQTPLDIQLAHTSQIAPGNLPSPVLEVRPNGNWVLDGNPVTPDLLATALAATDGPLHVMMDRDMQAKALIDVLRRTEQIDREVKLVTLRDGGTP